MGSEGEASDEPTEADEREFVGMANYRPFVADVPIRSFAEPFPITDPDMRTEWQIEKVRRRVRRVMDARKFDPPVPLADFCLVAHEKWSARDRDEPEKTCVLV